MASKWVVVQFSDHSEKRWQLLCDGFIASLAHTCTGPMGVLTQTGSPVYRTRADMLAAADTANWKRPTEDDPGTTDYCPASALILGL